MKKKLSTEGVPACVSKWTDQYFHQSIYDTPIYFPNKKVVQFLSKFKPQSTIMLYRGVHRYNDEYSAGIESWTYDVSVAKKYAESESGGRIRKKEFDPNTVLLDTTLLGQAEKRTLGYNYKVDDKEVLIFNNKK